MSIVGALAVVSLSAQDKIHRTNGKVLTVKVEEVNDDFILYKSITGDGPAFKINRYRVDKVVYQNGEVDEELFSARDELPTLDGSLLGKNIGSFDVVSLIYNEVGFGYERILYNGLLGVRIPLILGTGQGEMSSRQFSTLFQSGVDVNLYPARQGRFRYFIGPGFRAGRVNYLTYNECGVGLEPNSILSPGMQSILALQINNGLVLQATEHFSMTFLLAVGTRKFNSSVTGYNHSNRFTTFHVNVGYRL